MTPWGRSLPSCYFFFRSAEEKFSVNRSAKTVKDRKISKTDLDSCETDVPPVDKNGGVARAICSQEHLPSFLFFGHYAKTVWHKKNKKIFLTLCDTEVLRDYEFDDVTWAICSQEHLYSKNVDVRRNFFYSFFLASHMRGLNGKSYRKTSRTKFVGYLEVIRAGNFFSQNIRKSRR